MILTEFEEIEVVYSFVSVNRMASQEEETLFQHLRTRMNTNVLSINWSGKIYEISTKTSFKDREKKKIQLKVFCLGFLKRHF